MHGIEARALFFDGADVVNSMNKRLKQDRNECEHGGERDGQSTFTAPVIACRYQRDGRYDRYDPSEPHRPDTISNPTSHHDEKHEWIDQRECLRIFNHHSRENDRVQYEKEVLESDSKVWVSYKSTLIDDTRCNNN
jgi:hypothetical protein